MNCTETREILRSGEKPGEAMLVHLQECGECASIASREERLSEILREAPSVRLPTDFDRVLINKIENRRSENLFSSYLRPGVLVPVAATAALLAVFVIAFSLFRGQTSPETAGPGANAGPAASPERTVLSDDRPSEDSRPSGEVAGPAEADAPTDPGSRGTRSVPEPEEDLFENSSRDLAAGAPETITPPWFEDSPRDVPDKLPTRRISPGELLGEIGIQARFETGGWRVLSVRAASIAVRAGVLKGDLIKALDGHALTEEPLETGGKRLLVARAGRELTLTISP